MQSGAIFKKEATERFEELIQYHPQIIFRGGTVCDLGVSYFLKANQKE